jgi:tripartite-type tricarboxylate transporter receptor subunit TctC
VNDAMTRFRFVCAASIAYCALTASTLPAAVAQTYPARPVKLVVGYPPGGSGDFTTRIIADELTRELGGSVVVENRPGAGGLIAGEAVAKSTADGHTLLMAGNHAILKALFKKMPFDGERDFIPISLVANGPMIVTVSPSLPVKTLSELVDYAKKNPGKLFNAAPGSGSTPHLALVLFNSLTGADISNVQFKGGSPAVQSVLAGDTQVIIGTSPVVLPHIRSGKLRALSLTTRTKSPALPEILSTEEAGLPAYDLGFWFGLYTPSGTPPAVVKRLHEASLKILGKPEVKARLASQGMDGAPSASPEAFVTQIRREAPVWEKVVRESGARAE